VHVDKIVKLLKTKVSILEKFLDTAFHWPIRFRQKVLMVFFELRWNYSPLKEKAVLLPDGLFIYLSLRNKPHKSICRRRTVSAPDASRSAATGLAAWMFNRICRYAPPPLERIASIEYLLLPMQAV
jgi:hypothetical protein